jgi:hypothetical protein
VASQLSPLRTRSVSIGQPLDPPPQDLEGEESSNHPIPTLKDLKIFESKNQTIARFSHQKLARGKWGSRPIFLLEIQREELGGCLMLPSREN